MQTIFKLFLASILCALAGCNFLRNNGNGGGAPEEALAQAQVEGFLPGTIQGILYFNEIDERGLVIRGEISGLLPDSTYAVYIMEGTCDSPGATTQIFDPGNAQQHGPPWLSPGQRRAGILGNFTANGNGTLEFDYEVPSLDASGTSQFSVLGRSIVFFSQPDDYKTGSPGEKIACGEIDEASSNMQ